MKIIFKDELTYLDLLLPVLKIIKDNNIDKFLLFSKISKLDDFSKYDEDSIIKQVKKTLFYLKEVNYITYTNKLIRLTQKGVDHLSNLNKQENKIKKDINITSDERNEQLKKIERRYTNKINRELIKKYDIPDFPTLQQDLLAYIRDATYHIPTRKQMIINFIKSHHYTKEQIGILTMGIKEIMINSRAHVAIGDLKFLNLIEENENHEFYITKKGLKYVDNPELIKTINPTIHEFYINRKKEKNHETTSDSYDLKYDLSDELTYIDLLLVVLESINKSSETLKSLTDSIIKTNQFIEFDNDKIQKQVKITVKYLQKTEYVDIISDEIIITEKGINIVDNFNKEIDEIKSDNYQQDDKDEALLKKEEQYIRKINKNIQDTYNLPTQKSSVNTVIGYFKEYPDHKYDKKKDLVIDIIDKKIGLKNEVCNLLSVKKYRCIHTNLDFNISRLNRAGFLEKQDDCFRITKEGLKHVNDDNKTLNYIIEEKLNKDKSKVNNSDSISLPQLRHNTYNNIILNLLDNEKEYKRKNIILNTIKVLIPDYSDERTIFDLFEKPIKKSINNLLNDELIQRTEKHGYYKITQKGHELISDVRVNIEDKTRHEDNVNKENIFDNRIKNDDIKIESAVIHESESKDAKAFENKIYLKINPSDIFKKSYIKINKALPQKLLEKVKSCDPYFFEKLSLDLLKKMDFYKIKVYTGSLTSKSNDGGVDGVIYTDPLSIKPIYFQSKRWENSISRPEMQKFVGALHDRSAETGVFITTSDFTKGALKTVRSSNIRIINGEKLVELMIKYKIGVKTEEYQIDIVDEEYFQREDE